MSFFRTFLSVVFGMDPPPRQPTKTPPVCPQCQRALSPAADGLSECGICHGRWLSNDSFQAHLGGAEAPPESNQPSSGQHTYGRSPSPRVCPACDALMENYQFAYRSGIWIDACPDKHGVWLDSGELPMIRDYHQKTLGPMTRDEKAKMSMAFLDGATQARSNLNSVNEEIRRQNQAREANYTDHNRYDY